MEKGNEGASAGPQVAKAGDSGGGGAAANQTKERDKGIPTGEIVHPDGSRLRFTEDGGATYTDPSGKTGLWSKRRSEWVDPDTREPLPEGFGDARSDFINRGAEMTASDWEAAAGQDQTDLRAAREAGNPDLVEHYQRRYDEAVSKARESRR